MSKYKTISERLAERPRKKVSKKAKNRAAFLAVRAEVKAALDDGWSMFEIWELLFEEKKIEFSYQSFRNYTNKLITTRQTAKKHEPTQSGNNLSNQKTPEQTGNEKNGSQSYELPSFQHNPTRKKEDLI